MNPLPSLSLLLFLPLTLCIRFSFNLPPGHFQCFHQIIQQDSKFQIILKSTTPQITLQISADTGVIATLSDHHLQKSYAGFSDSNDQVLFCLHNPTNIRAKSLVQFQHGMSLEAVKQVITKSDFELLKEGNEKMRKIVLLLKHNLKFYSQRMRARVLKHYGVSWVYNLVTLLLIVAVSMLSFCHLFSFKRFLRDKKYI